MNSVAVRSPRAATTHRCLEQIEETYGGKEAGDGLLIRTDLHSPRDIPDAIFLQLVMVRELHHHRHLRLGSGQRSFDEPDAGCHVLIADTTSRRRTYVLELPEGQLAIVDVKGDSAEINLAAGDAEALERAVDFVTGEFEGESEETDLVSVSYWASGSLGSTSVARRVRMPSWEQLAEAYPDDTRRAMEPLLAEVRPEHARLVLWHGPPGTGKTNAVRALARAWSQWCVSHFISDPEALLGDGSYLLDVLTSDDPDRALSRDWRLVILEDAGELLTPDAHARTGQALSRLLNATDGLLAQTTNSVVLVTTNEPLRVLHPAVARQGRCLAEVEFRPLPAEAANRWLRGQGCEATVTGPTTIADLWAIAEGRAEPPEDRRVGFAR